MIYALEILAFMSFFSQPALDGPSTPTLCEDSESTVFFGQVEDDFGLDVAVCLSGENGEHRLTIRWEGEGGGSSVSCAQGNCDGRIEYSRYTSPHLTVLTLAWRDGKHVQWLTQTTGRDDLDEPATGETRHFWQTPGTAREDALDYPVNTNADDLSLMALETILETKPWHRPLLEEAQP